MKKYIKYITMILIIVVIITMLVIANNTKTKNDDGKFKIVASFYPIYVMTANITEGAQNVELLNMAEVNVGCVHDYTLTTADMKKVETADAFIQNGLGLEGFITKVTESNEKMKIIDSSENIENLIKENEEINPHIWTSISNYIAQVGNITKELKKVNPENAGIYEKNSKEYVEKLEQLNLKYNRELQNLQGKSAVILNESFEYLARDLKLNSTVVHTSHEESTMSAEMLKNIIDEMKQKGTKIIIVDVNDDLKNAQTIANETEAQIYKLNSGVSGELKKEAYLEIMNSNLEILKQIYSNSN